MSKDLELLAPKIKQWRNNLSVYGKDCATIVNKDRKEVPFKLNKAQEYMEARVEDQLKRKGYVRAILLKGRQQGCSKWATLRQLRNSTILTNILAFVMAHDKSTTSELFEDYKALYDTLPNIPVVKPPFKTSNERVMRFSHIKSSIKVGTAGSVEVGRGFTVNRFHGSEVAFWPDGDKTLAGVLQAIPLREGNGTEVILESTANGVGNFFFRICMQAMKGEGEFELIFIPWWWTEEYQLSAEYEPSDEAWEYYDTWMRNDCPDEEEAVRKLAWRQAKIFELGEKKFKQEYPANAMEAFQMSGSSLFKPEWIKCARDTKLKEDKSQPLIIGVDAAEAGGDRTSICFRRGKKIIKFMVYDEMDEMRLAGICSKLINAHKPDRMFFDKSYANGCVGRLRELGYGAIVSAIPFGSNPIEPDRFLNKRAEMHWMLKEWLEDGYVSYDAETGVGGVDIPDIDDFNADLACIPEPPPTSNGKIKMVAKDKIKDEFGMSPDMLDSAILTFAEPFLQNRDSMSVKVKTKSATDKIFGRK